MINFADPFRGTGRSSRQLMATRGECFYVVSYSFQIRYYKSLIAKLGLKNKIHMVPMDNIERKIRGTTLPVHLDHDVLDKIEIRVFKEVAVYNARFFIDG